MSQLFNTIDEAVEKYVELRDYLGVERKKFDALEKDIKSELEQISMWLRDKGDNLGVDSFNTRYGTAYRAVKTSYTCGNWQEFIDWVIKTNNTQCLEHRVAKLATKEIHDVTGELPPGVNYSAEVEFLVRRPTKSSKE